MMKSEVLCMLLIVALLFATLLGIACYIYWELHDHLWHLYKHNSLCYYVVEYVGSHGVFVVFF